MASTSCGPGMSHTVSWEVELVAGAREASRRGEPASNARHCHEQQQREAVASNGREQQFKPSKAFHSWRTGGKTGEHAKRSPSGAATVWSAVSQGCVPCRTIAAWSAAVHAQRCTRKDILPGRVAVAGPLVDAGPRTSTGVEGTGRAPSIQLVSLTDTPSSGGSGSARSSKGGGQ